MSKIKKSKRNSPESPVQSKRVSSSIRERILEAVFRLAIAESDRAPEIARALDSRGHQANRKALTELVRKAQARGLVVAGDPATLAARYLAMLWGNLLIRLLMRVREAPTKREIDARARAATETLLAVR